MKKYLILISILAVLIAGWMTAQKKSAVNYTDQWKKIDQLAEKQLPESALKEVQAVIDHSVKEKNVAQLIKATIYKMRFTLEINPDNAPQIIRDFEQFAHSSADKLDKALLYSMTADLYAQYYTSQRWTINRRTELAGHKPEDIKEWTKNIFYDKIVALLDSSLTDVALLQKNNKDRYVILLEKGKDSEELEPTMFDFLSQRKIELLLLLDDIANQQNPLTDEHYMADALALTNQQPDTAFANSTETRIINTYRELIAFHIQDKKPDALIYNDLKRLVYVYSKNQDKDSYIKALNALQKKFADTPYVVEVMAERANWYLSVGDDKTAKRKAYDICREGISKFPQYKRIGLLKNIAANITNRNISFFHNDFLKPGANLKLNINSTNASAIKIEIYKVNATALEYQKFKQTYQNRTKGYPKRTLQNTYQMAIKADPDFGSEDTTFVVKAGNYGIYELVVTDVDKKSSSAPTTFVVTDFGYIARANEPGKQSFYVLDRVGGQLQSNVTIAVYEPKWNGNGYDYILQSTTKTDKNGLSIVPFTTNYYERKVFFERGADQYFSNQAYASYYNADGQVSKELKISLFTDRSLYRPGQTVYFKGITYYANKDRNDVSADESCEVTLYDANYQKISSKTFKTNAFGSFVGEFVLPEGGLNGAFTLKTKYGSQVIFVEEYKRPTFEVIIKKPASEIRFGESVSLIGEVKAYAGYQIGNAKVNYRVMRVPHRYCWWWSEPEKEIAKGTATSDADGKFAVSFVPEKPVQSTNLWRGTYYTYTVYADVTDPKGETQQGEQSLSVGDKSLFIISQVPEKVEKNSSLKFDVYTETINAEKLVSNIRYEVYRLEEQVDYLENLTGTDHLKQAEKVASGDYNTSAGKLALNYSKWKSGRYKLALTTKDKYGAEVKTENVFLLYGDDDKRPPVKAYVWMLTPKTECAVDEKALIRFGTSTENSMVLYEIMQGSRVLESGWVKISNEIKTFEIPFKEEYGDGVNVLFTFMKDEKVFNNQVQITRKKETRKLTPAWSVFRSKLQPGDKAEWTVTIPEVKDKKLEAEVLVGMYDASLDAIRPHSWNFNPLYQPVVAYSPIWSGSPVQMVFGNLDYFEKSTEIADILLDRLNWFNLSLANYSNRIRIRGAGKVVNDASEILSVAAPAPAEMSMGKSKVSMMVPSAAVLEEVVTVSDKDAGTKKEKTPQVRTNFNETAFFYPQLRTDAQGNVKVSFTAPESLTRWNVKMLAHTAGLYVGQLDTTTVTQKELMVQMNLPRFVRRSDKLVLTANVVNLSDKTLTAKVNFELIDPATDKPVRIRDNKVRTVTVAPKETQSVEWELTEFSPFELVVCKAMAQAGNFSDGEQKYLAVLPDKVLITESQPLIIRNNQTREFRFESLIKNASKVDTKNLTVEFSSNPAWYAVQALPTLSAPDDDNALGLFTAYYVNSLAGYIANSNPKITRVFDQWKNAKGSREALLSNLEKNTELKNMLLEETPWMMAAKDETEQKRQIALLFDLNMQKNQAQQYLDKLIKLQTSNGGFTWFAGMPESRYITQEVLLNMARLQKLTKTALPDNYRASLAAAINYLDLEISKDFSELKKYNKDYLKQNSVGNMQLFYLHLRSEYPEIEVPAFAREAVKYYTAQAEKYWTSFTLYGKAMMAVVAQRNGKAKVAQEILKSLKENALKTDEMGMYWAKNTSGYFWNERPVAVQAAIIEAFAELSKNTSDVDELKIWLLKQKQTQRWDSPIASVNAVYALLLQGNDWLGNEAAAKISVGNQVVTPSAVEAGTGYFKETIPAHEVSASTGKITVSSPNQKTGNSGIGWGAMYWQYYQEQSKVDNSGGALKVTKKLFVKDGNAMMPVEQAKLKKGDKVATRLVITTDRNLEFVALKDLRAACFEPVNQRSGCEWKEGVCYYQTTKDASTQFFFSYLPKGTYVFEYELWVNNAGTFTSGVTSIQCQYAPEFVSYAGGEVLKVW